MIAASPEQLRSRRRVQRHVERHLDVQLAKVYDNYERTLDAVREAMAGKDE